MAKRKVSITLKVAELVYDIENRTYLVGRSRSNADNYEAVSNMQVDGEEENRAQVYRSISSAVDIIKTQLSRYIDTDDENADASNQLPSMSSDIVIKLSMPQNYAFYLNNAVATQMHNYIVNKCIGEWFLITNQEEAEEYINTASANLEAMRFTLNKRVRPVRYE